MFQINRERLPQDFPTHRHSSEFWEQLGRAVATFGFLEEIIKKAIFALTATRPYSPDEISGAFDAWEAKLESTLTGTLKPLIESYGQALRDHPDANVDDLERLIENLGRAALLRNVLCHGSWQSPSESGESIPRFVGRKLESFETPMSTEYLKQIRKGVAELACDIIDSVTGMGLQFPGSNGPGKPI